jgi:hypothetical protein
LIDTLDTTCIRREPPDIVAAILDETLPPEVTLFELAAGTSLLWVKQWANVVENNRCRRTS